MKPTPQDQVVAALYQALSEFGPETLRQVEDEALERNPEGWLPKMLSDYLDMW